MRKGFDGSAVVRPILHRDPMSGELLVIINRHRERVLGPSSSRPGILSARPTVPASAVGPRAPELG